MRGRLFGVLLVLIATSCDGPVDPLVEEPFPTGDKVVVELSASALSLLPGETRAVRVSVTRRGDELELKASGLPDGVAATFSPERLGPEVTESELTLSAGHAAPAAVVAATVSAVNRSGTGVASAQLNVQVCPGYAIPDQCPPFPTGGPHTVSGVVRYLSANGSVPRPGHELWAWVQMPNYGYVRGRVTSDSTGRFEFDNIPGGTVMIEAWNALIDQPCASTVTLSGGNGQVDVDITSIAEPMLIEDPQAPALTGVVWEQTSGGRTPVAGARVQYDILDGNGLVAASTTTDAHGRYALCRLPTFGVGHTLFVSKNGYRVEDVPVAVSGVSRADVELSRL